MASRTTNTLKPEKFRFFFLICWLTYFSTYLGRNSYPAVLAEIIATEAYPSTACGLVVTGFFICYGVGQFFSGYLGDIVSPKWMIFTGVAVSALANLAMPMANSPQIMLVLWCINGVFQSMTWSPLVRTIAEFYPLEFQGKYLMLLSTTYPVGLLLSYASTAGIIKLMGWRSVFVFNGIIILLVACLWFMGFARMEKHRTVSSAVAGTIANAASMRIQDLLRMPHLGVSLLLIGLALIVQGALRDGIMTWIPTYITEVFHMGTAISIFCTTLLPIVNLLGVKSARILQCRPNSNEMKISGVFFLVASLFSLLLLLFGDKSFLVTVIMFSVVTSSMMGVNIMLVSIIPTHFVKQGKVSFISGTLNSMVYIGSSLATFGIGAFTDHFGWSSLIVLLSATCILGVIVCTFGVRPWRRACCHL